MCGVVGLTVGVRAFAGWGRAAEMLDYHVENKELSSILPSFLKFRGHACR